MESDRQQVLEKQKKRFEVLKAIYLDTNGEETKASLSSEISSITGIPPSELAHILRYLQKEELIKALRSINDNNEPIPIQILHRGVVEIEAVMSKPDEPTEHFPAQVFYITNQSSVTTQQFGNQNNLTVIQRNDLDKAVKEIQQLLNQLEHNYPTETFTQKAAIVEEALEQIKGDPSFKGRVMRVLKSAGKEALKEAIDHPLVNVFIAGIEGWQEGD